MSSGRRILISGILSSLLVASCDGGASPTRPPAPAASEAAAAGTPVPLPDAGTIRVGVFPNVTHAPGLIALADGGPLAQLLPGADIEVMAFDSGTTAVEALFADAIDMTYVGPNPAINAYGKSDGRAVRIVAGSTLGGAFFVVKPDILDAEGLRGKTIATPGLGNTQDVALRSWLNTNGLSSDLAGGGDVSIVPQPNAQTLDTFQAGTIDGAWVPEPWATRLITEAGAHVLVDERDLWPDGKYVTTQLMVATSFLDAHPDIVERVVLATIEAIDQIDADPAGSRTIVNDEIERFTSKRLGDDVLGSAWTNLTFTVDPAASSLMGSATAAESLGLLDDPGDLSGLYDLTILDRLLRTLGRPEVTGP
jgi:sulfonate transport system substrate-binding protein